MRKASCQNNRRAQNNAHWSREIEHVVHHVLSLSPEALARKLKQMESQMLEHAKNLEFEEVARVRDEMTEIKQQTFLNQA